MQFVYKNNTLVESQEDVIKNDNKYFYKGKRVYRRPALKLRERAKNADKNQFDNTIIKEKRHRIRKK